MPPAERLTRLARTCDPRAKLEVDQERESEHLDAILLGASALLAACHGSKPGRLSVAEQRKLIDRYCIECHSVKDHAGDLTLEGADLAQVARDPQMWEKMIRKLRAGMMPPPGARAARRGERSSALRRRRSRTRSTPRRPSIRIPAARPFQRLNRAEYARAVHDLLDLDVDVNAFLPPDTISAGFDNVADVQTFSPTLMEGYLRAAGTIAASRSAIASAPASSVTYKRAAHGVADARTSTARRWARAAASRWSTRFPADGEYTFRVTLHSDADRRLCSAATCAATSRSRCRSTASASRCSTSTPR